VSLCDLSHAFWLLGALALVPAEVGSGSYRAEIQQWRETYEASLKKDNGWLTLAGLYWLKDGGNSLGAGLGNDIVLPEGTAPKIAGTFVFQNGKTSLRVNNGVSVLANGKPVRTESVLKPDSEGTPDRITLGRLSMIVIRRGSRYGVRLWDNESRARREFGGVRWFPIHESYRVTAQFTPYPQPKMIPILNVLGDTEQNPSPGYATFQLAGKVCRLEPLLEDGALFFLIKDLTNGKQTYPAGRFLDAGLPKDGKVILDFNQAVNPPCAFTAYATCPLPPKQNHLPVEIAAGEQKPYSAAASH
jgi:uncharacterized protein (DUF1684 family)